MEKNRILKLFNLVLDELVEMWGIEKTVEWAIEADFTDEEIYRYIIGDIDLIKNLRKDIEKEELK